MDTRNPPAADLGSSTGLEPTLQQWQDLIGFLAFEDRALRHTVSLLLKATESGRAYLERATRYRPRFEQLDTLDFEAMADAFDALERLEELIADPHFGVELGVLDWEGLWDVVAAVATEDFHRLIHLSYVLEQRAATEADRERIRCVREGLDAELIVKQHEELMARRSGFLSREAQLARERRPRLLSGS